MDNLFFAAECKTVKGQRLNAMQEFPTPTTFNLESPSLAI